jgi:hypothetical protein
MPQIGWIWSGSQTINKGASYTIILPAPQPVGAPPPPIIWAHLAFTAPPLDIVWMSIPALSG